MPHIEEHLITLGPSAFEVNIYLVPPGAAKVAPVFHFAIKAVLPVGKSADAVAAWVDHNSVVLFQFTQP